MSYDSTKVPIAQSQAAIRNLIYAHDGTAVNFLSQRPREGFEALVTLRGDAYHIRVMATCAHIDEISPQGKRRGQDALRSLREAEERRVWRVLFWHLKAMFEAADSGVIDMRDVIMPYVVTPDGRTLAEHIAPRMKEIQTLDPAKLLTGR